MGKTLTEQEITETPEQIAERVAAEAFAVASKAFAARVAAKDRSIITGAEKVQLLALDGSVKKELSPSLAAGLGWFAVGPNSQYLAQRGVPNIKGTPLYCDSVNTYLAVSNVTANHDRMFVALLADVKWACDEAEAIEARRIRNNERMGKLCAVDKSITSGSTKTPEVKTTLADTLKDVSL